MKKVTLKIYDLCSIRTIVICQIILIMFISIVVILGSIINPGNIILVILFLVCVLVQIHLKSQYGIVIVTTESIEITSNKVNIKVTWDNVKGVYYNSMKYIFPELKQGTLDLFLLIDGEVYDVDSTLGNIKVNKKQYKEIVSMIPKECFEQNEFLIYRSLADKMKYNKED